VYNGGAFTMSGAAVVAQDNDVYLPIGKVLTVGELTGSGLAAKITLENTDANTAVLQAAAGTTLTTGTRNRFTLGDGIAMAIKLEANSGKLTNNTMELSIGGSTAYYPSIKAAISAVSDGTAESPVTIGLLADVTISQSDAIALTSGQHIRLVPEGADITIRRASDLGSLFTVQSGASLTLEGGGENELVIDGGAGDGLTVSAALVTVSGGTFTMKNGVTLTDNKYSGVNISNGGKFDMQGGTISGNTTSNAGGGVRISNGTFTMSDGEISGNTTSNAGGGVRISNGTFTMSGGEISGNTANGGGGVWIDGTFNMSGGTISGNNANGPRTGDGGVCMGSTNSTTFTMSGGKISGNMAKGQPGGGVYVDGISFTMSDSAVVDQDNYVYLSGTKVITVGALTPGPDPVAKIKPQTATSGTAVLKAASGTLTYDIISRFTPTDDIAGVIDLNNEGQGIIKTR
jgi:hypothetical protein